MKMTLIKAGHTIAKHAPAIYTTVGVAGLGATAYLAYKSRDKVEVVIEKMEENEAAGYEPNYQEIGTGMIKALYLPITVGVLSVASIFMSHKVSRGRILALSGALAAQQAQNALMETKYRATHGDKKFEDFMAPTETVEVEGETKDGKKKVTKEQIKDNMNETIGAWYSESEHYAKDDHTYNLAFIEAAESTLQTRLFSKGSLLLNEVRDELGLARTPNGALLGWTVSDSFDILKSTSNVGIVEQGETREQIWMKWSPARFIYDEVDLSGGRYS